MGRYTRLLPAILCFVGLVLGAKQARAATVTVRVATLEAAPGGTVEVPIEVAGASAIGAMHLELVYDPAVLTAKTVTRGALLGDNALLEFNTATAGRVIIGLVTLDGLNGDGVIANVGFDVVGSKGQRSGLTLENSTGWEATSHVDVLVNGEAGAVTVAAAGLPWLLIAAGLLLLLLLLMLLGMSRRRRRRRRLVPAVQGGSFCQACGNALPAEARFCNRCGAATPVRS